MVARGQEVVESGLSVGWWGYQRLVEVADAAARLGAPEAVLETLPYRIHFFAADDLRSPNWWLDVEVARAGGRIIHNRYAIVAPPGAIRDALRLAGAPEGQRYVHGMYGSNYVVLVGPDGEGVARGRVVPLRGSESAVDVDLDPVDGTVAAARVDIDSFKSAVLGSRGGHIELRVVGEPGAGWGVYVVGERGAPARLWADVTAGPERGQLVGRYPAAVLRELLLLDYLTSVKNVFEQILVRFTDSADSPVLRARWHISVESVSFGVASLK